MAVEHVKCSLNNEVVKFFKPFLYFKSGCHISGMVSNKSQFSILSLRNRIFSSLWALFFLNLLAFPASQEKEISFHFILALLLFLAPNLNICRIRSCSIPKWFELKLHSKLQCILLGSGHFSCNSQTFLSFHDWLKLNYIEPFYTLCTMVSAFQNKSM